jgi:hypothetical protein
VTDEGLTLPGSFAQGDPVLRPPSAADIDRITEICQDPEIQRYSRLPVPYHRDGRVVRRAGAAGAAGGCCQANCGDVRPAASSGGRSPGRAQPNVRLTREERWVVGSGQVPIVWIIVMSAILGWLVGSVTGAIIRHSTHDRT